MTKCCDLCKLTATTYCQSDRASLCWDCDSKVHGANFLVARHVRGLLCRACQSLTPWRASGSFLGRSTVSLCHTCSPSTEPNKSRRQGSEGKEDGEIQVVPFASESVTPPAPTDSSSSSSSSSFASSLSSCFRKEDGEISLKRIRDTSSSSNLLSLLQKGIGGSSSQGQRGSTSEAGGEEEAAATRVEFDSSPRKTKKRMVGENYPLEYRRTGTGAAHSRAGSRCGEKIYKKKDKEAATRKFN